MSDEEANGPSAAPSAAATAAAPPPPVAAASAAAAAWKLDEIDDEDAWLRAVPPNSSSSSSSSNLGELLKRLDRQLRCEICGDLLKRPTKIVTCGHTFCSECVRTQLQVERKNPCVKSDLCPHGQCRKPLYPDGNLMAYERFLRPNQDLQNIVDTFQSLRAPLLQALQAAFSSSSPKGKRRGRNRSRDGRGNNNDDESSSSDDDNDKSHRPAPAKKPKGAPANRETTLRRKILPVKFKSMKLKELKELCREMGVNDGGGDVEMRSRLDRFCVYWNARYLHETEAQIRKGFDQVEREQKRAQRDDARAGAVRDATLINQLFANRRSATTTTTTTTNTGQAYESTGDPDFDRKLKGGFASLIESGRRRLQEERDRKRREAEQAATTAVGTDTETAAQQPDNAASGSPLEQNDATGAAATSSNQGAMVSRSKSSPSPGNGSPAPGAPGHTASESSPALSEGSEHRNEERSPVSPTRGVGPSLATSTAANRSERVQRISSTAGAGVDLPSMFVDLTDDVGVKGPDENCQPDRAGSEGTPSGAGPAATSASQRKKQRPGGRKSDSSKTGAWQCPRCTLINRTMSCEVCDLVHLSREYDRCMRTAQEEGVLLDAL